MTSKIEQQVMASVGVIYAARALFSKVALECYALVISLLALWKLVWVTRVFENFFAVEKRGIGAISYYLLTAVEHTHVAVQLTLLVGVLAFVALVVDGVRSLGHSQSHFA